MPEPEDTRNTEIAKLAAEGVPHTELAIRYGISRQRVGQIAAKGKAHESERVTQLRSKYSELQKVVSHPPAKTTAIGRTVTDPDTGQTVRDMGAYIAAAREQRMVLSELRREEDHQRSTAADDLEQQQIMSDFMAYVSDLSESNQRLTAEVADLRNRLASYETENGEMIWPAEVV